MSFLNLPGELRNKIYAHYFSDQDNYGPALNEAVVSETMVLDDVDMTDAYDIPETNHRSYSFREQSPIGAVQVQTYNGNIHHVSHSMMEDWYWDWDDLAGPRVETMYDSGDKEGQNYGPELDEELGVNFYSVEVQDRREIIVDQEGYLYANIPALSLTCRTIFTETWCLNFDKEAKLFVHIDDYNIRQVNGDFGVLSLLRELCKVHITEENTAVVLHTFTPEGIDPQTEGFAGRLNNLKSWIRSYLAGETYLFSTNLEIMQYDWKSGHGLSEDMCIIRQKARFEGEFLALIRNFHIIRHGDPALWRQLAISFVNDYDAVEVPSQSERVDKLDDTVSDAELEEEMIMAVIGLVDPKQVLPINVRSWKELELGFAVCKKTYAEAEKLLSRT